MKGLRRILHVLLILKHIYFQVECPQSFNWSHFLGWMSSLTYSRMIVLIFKILHCTSFHQMTLRGQLLVLVLIVLLFCQTIICCLSHLHGMLSIECRSKKNLKSIFEFMNAEKSMLRSSIDGVELLVFTSNQLNMHSRGKLLVSCISCATFLTP